MNDFDSLCQQRTDLFVVLRDMMGEPDFTNWYIGVLREKLAEVKGDRANRDRGPLHLVDTQDLTRTASFEAAQKGRGKR